MKATRNFHRNLTWYTAIILRKHLATIWKYNFCSAKSESVTYCRGKMTSSIIIKVGVVPFGKLPASNLNKILKNSSQSESFWLSVEESFSEKVRNVWYISYNLFDMVIKISDYRFKTNQYKIEIKLGQFQGPRSIFQDKFELGHSDS